MAAEPAPVFSVLFTSTSGYNSVSISSTIPTDLDESLRTTP